MSIDAKLTASLCGAWCCKNPKETMDMAKPEWCRQDPNGICHCEVSEQGFDFGWMGSSKCRLRWRLKHCNCQLQASIPAEATGGRNRGTDRLTELGLKNSEVTAEFQSKFFDLLEDKEDFISVQRAVNEARNKLSKRKLSKKKSCVSKKFLSRMELRWRMDMRIEHTS